MKIVAIIPVKTFSKSKTRLNLSLNQREDLCRIMLEEVVETISNTKNIDKIIVVSKDEEALKLTKKFDVIEIFDDDESGVNHAVSLADNYLANNEWDTSIIFPQDIPFIQSEDIEDIIQFSKSTQSILVIPSRRFDGTNALLRRPHNLMKTHYDEDSYKIHLEIGKSMTSNTSLILLRRIMLDIDNQEDLKFLLSHNEKPEFCTKINQIC
ncbi:MAG: 2-phospho-L-lactate guanylyltransferase [Thaumarchaeota archaeon]|nr:2-phospho-L-lactate guanylyltransferase [Nitrososphaerota archaeon]